MSRVDLHLTAKLVGMERVEQIMVQLEDCLNKARSLSRELAEICENDLGVKVTNIRQSDQT